MFCLEIYLELLEGIQNGPPSVSPRPAHAGLPLAVYLLSRGKHFTSSTRMDIQSVAPPCLRQLKPPWANMQISQAHTGGPVRKQDKEPCNCLLSWIIRAIQDTEGIIIHSVERTGYWLWTAVKYLQFLSLVQKQWSVRPHHFNLSA